MTFILSFVVLKNGDSSVIPEMTDFKPRFLHIPITEVLPDLQEVTKAIPEEHSPSW